MVEREVLRIARKSCAKFTSRFEAILVLSKEEVSKTRISIHLQISKHVTRLVI